jgi:hypothetical protein
MLAEHRQFVLPEGNGGWADVYINSTGTIKVNITHQNCSFEGEFDQLSFHTSGRKTELICKRDPQQSEWHVNFANQDARELALLIERAEDEFELLMRDL